MSGAKQPGNRNRRFWLYGLAGVFLLVFGRYSFCVTTCLAPLGRSHGRECFVEFERDAVAGFPTFRVASFNRTQVEAYGQSRVTAQVKPRVSDYLKPSKPHRVQGGAMVFVTEFMPPTYPNSWGSVRVVIRQRTDVGLRPVGQ